MKRILFVDDDPVVLRIYKDALSKHGFQVEPARDVSTASKILKGTKPDLLVLDLMMPKREGVEILNLIRSQPDLAGLPVVMLSNSYTDGLSRDGAALGPHRALLKVQCTPSILLGVIRRSFLPIALENSANIKQLDRLRIDFQSGQNQTSGAFHVPLSQADLGGQRCQVQEQSSGHPHRRVEFARG